MARFLAALVLVATASAAGAQEAAPFDKSAHPWLRWKEGSTVKWRLTAGADTWEQVQNLTKVTDEDFTTELVSRSFESVNVVFTDFEKLPTRDGNEILKIGDREHRCTVWKAAATRHGADAESRYWIDAEGRLLKVAKTQDMNRGPLAIQAVRLAEKLKVAGRDLACLRLEGSARAPTGGDAKVVFWMNREIPGGTAKMQVTYSSGRKDVTIVVEAVAYEGKK